MDDSFEGAAYEARCKMVEDLVVQCLFPLYQTSPHWSCKRFCSSKKTPVLFTYLGGGLKIQHCPAHIQNRCYPAEERFFSPFPTLYPDTRAFVDLALGTEDERNGFNLRLEIKPG